MNEENEKYAMEPIESDMYDHSQVEEEYLREKEDSFEKLKAESERDTQMAIAQAKILYPNIANLLK